MDREAWQATDTGVAKSGTQFIKVVNEVSDRALQGQIVAYTFEVQQFLRTSDIKVGSLQ